MIEISWGFNPHDISINLDSTQKDFPKINYFQTINSSLIGLLKFIFLVILFFLLPGYLLSRNVVLAIPVGLTIFTLFNFLIGYLHLSIWLNWLLPIISTLLLIKRRASFNFPNLNLKQISLPPILIILVGSASWLITMVNSGLSTSLGLEYWGSNGHDGIWHLSLISELQRQFPPQNPIFASTALNNYHYFYDLLLARSSSLFSIDNQDLLFRFFPILITFFSGILMYLLVKKLHSKTAANIATFLFYFGGSLGWIVTLLKQKSFNGESIFWSMQAVSTLLNPPFAISIVLFLTGLWLLDDYLKHTSLDKLNIKYLISLVKNNLSLILTFVLVVGSLIEFKAYGGVLFLIGLILFTLERAFFFKDYRLVLLTLSSILLSLLVFLPNNAGSNGLFIFAPLWFVASMVTKEDGLRWPWLSILIKSSLWYKIVASYLIGTVIFLIGNLGVRSLFLLNPKTTSQYRIILYISFASILIPLLFIQKGTAWNSIQFFYYGLISSSILAGIVLAKFIKNTNLQIAVLIIAILFLINLPTTLATDSTFFNTAPGAYLPNSEIEALTFLKQQPPGIVMTLTYNPGSSKRFISSPPLYAYTSTAYVSAFSNHPSFLEDLVNMESMNINYKGRLNDQLDLQRTPNRSKEIFKKYNISYLYIVRSFDFGYQEQARGIQKIFENQDVVIFKVI